MGISALHLLANEMFSFIPGAEQNSYYYCSHHFNLKSIPLPEHEKFLTKDFSSIDYNFDKYIVDQEILGPYERHLLGAILHASERFLFVVGGIGAGKSSSLLFLRNFYAEHKTEIPNYQSNTILNGISTDIVEEIIDADPAPVFVDLQSESNIIADAKENGAADNDLIDMVYDRFTLKIISSIAESIRQHLSNYDVIMKHLLDIVVKLVKGSLRFENGPEFKFQDLASISGKLSSYVEGSKTIEECLPELSPEHRLRTSLAIVEVLSRIMSCKFTNPIFLILDNIDSLPGKLQQTFSRFVFNRKYNTTYHIIIPTRVSTFRTINFTNGYNWFPHCAPNPLEIVTTKLFSFIHKPEQYGAYRVLQEDAKKLAIYRAFDLILRLHRGNGNYRIIAKLTQAFAGDSIRHAFQCIGTLFYSEHFSYSYDTTIGVEQLKHETNKVVFRYMVRCLFDDIGSDIKNEIICYSKNTHSPDTTPNSIEKYLVQLVNNLFNSILNRVAKHTSSILNENNDQENASLLHDTWSNTSSDRLCYNRINQGIVAIMNIATNKGADEFIMKSILLQSIPIIHSVALSISQTKDEFTQIILLRISGLLVNAVNSNTSDCSVPLVDSEDDISWESEDISIGEYDEWDESQLCRNILKINAPRTVAYALLMDNKLINLFINPQTKRYSPLLLRVIYKLASTRENMMHLCSLYLDLTKHGYQHQEIVSAIKLLSSIENNLVWSNKINYNDTPARYEMDDSYVILTRSGKSVYRDMVSDTTYLLYNVGGGNDWDGRWPLEEMLRMATSSLEEIFNIEMQRLNDYSTSLQVNNDDNNSYIETEIPDIFIVSDVMTKATHGVYASMHRHFENVKNNNNPSRRKLTQNKKTDKLNRIRGAMNHWYCLFIKINQEANKYKEAAQRHEGQQSSLYKYQFNKIAEEETKSFYMQAEHRTQKITWLAKKLSDRNSLWEEGMDYDSFIFAST